MEEIWKKFGSIEVSNLGHVKTPRNKDGSYTGHDNGKGYKRVAVYIENKFIKHSVHRIVAHLFLDITLDDPRQVDHINGIRDDNRVDNLRMVSSRENTSNTKAHRGGKLLGVHYIKNKNRWSSKIYFNGKIIYLGCFKTEKEAHEAYLNALNELK